VDSGFEYGIVEGLINTFILPYFVDMTVFDSKPDTLRPQYLERANINQTLPVSTQPLTYPDA